MGDKDLVAQLCRMGTIQHRGDMAHMAQPSWTGTACHSYGAVTGGDSRQGAGAEPDSRDPSSTHQRWPHGGGQ